MVTHEMNLILAPEEEQKLTLDRLIGLEPAFRQLALFSAQEIEMARVSRLSIPLSIQLMNYSQHKLFQFSIEVYKAKGESILIIDDVEEQRTICSQILKKLGLTVNAVCPAAIDTPGLAEASEEFRQKLIESTPVGRIGKPEEIAAAVLWLCSDLAGFVTGTGIIIDGGVSTV